MSLAVGARLGVFEVLGTLGAGGMGEVYRAHDTRLNRDVALKVLPDDVAGDHDRVARFRREAQLLASLNHPNIAAIYGLEESGGIVALALELVEGEDLSERLRRGAIPVEEALGIARQIAEALEEAHERGVVHRDLKPGNVKVTPEGKVKVLDFGLAKAFSGEDVSASGSNRLADSPTMSRHMTEAGVILGTAAYMAPEQARGKTVDKRADIWAFGVVLYEMLTAQRAFKGDDISEILAAVLRDTPDLDRLPGATPPGIRRLLGRCLERDPRQRLRDIGEARLALTSTADESAVVTPVQMNRRARWLALLPWVIAASALAVLGWTLVPRARSIAVSVPPTYVDLTFPPGVEPVSGLTGGVSISPDGRTIAMVGVKGGPRRLYVRRLDRLDAVEISDASGINAVAFSPDSGSLVYLPGSGVLTRVSLTDEQRVRLSANADLTASLAWTSAGIVYTHGGALWIVPAQVGAAHQLTTLDEARHEISHTDAAGLPGGRAVLFTSVTTERGTERIEAVQVDSGQRSVVMERAVSPAYSSTGHLLFGRDGAILAVPLDPAGVTVRGEAVPVIPAGAVGAQRPGGLGFQVSTNGTLVFLPADFDTKHLVSVSRDGSVRVIDRTIGQYANPRISPDGRRLLVTTGGSLLETLDLVRGTRERVTAAVAGTGFSTWMADGASVVFRRSNLPFWAAVDGSGGSGLVAGGSINDFPSAPGPTADSFLDVRIRPETSGDIFLISKSGSVPPKALVATPDYDGGPQLSPDRRWLLYQSAASGQPEIYVRRFPTLDRQWQVSEGGGWQARWSTTGREIYYRNGHSMMAVVPDLAGSEPTFGTPVALFADEYDYGQGISIANYDVTPDGRFIMLSAEPRGGTVKAVINWTSELEQILAAGGVR